MQQTVKQVYDHYITIEPKEIKELNSDLVSK